MNNSNIERFTTNENSLKRVVQISAFIKNPSAKVNFMKKKELKKFFGHNWKNPVIFVPCVIIAHDKINYTLFPDRNSGLCDITPIDEWSNDYLAMHRGTPISILGRNFNE